MASIGQLVRTVAAVSGYDESAVKLIARYVREGGHIGQKSTGAGAAQMTSYDAAALLIALNGSTLTKNSAIAVSEFSGLPLHLDGEEETEYVELKQISSDLRDQETFGACLSRLIEICTEEAGSVLIENEGKPYKIDIAVKFEQPNKAASIMIYDEDRKRGNKTIVVHRVFADLAVEASHTDRSVEVYITGKTIGAVAKTIAS